MVSIKKALQLKQLSISHVNKAFDISLLEDLCVEYLRSKKYFDMNIVCAGTNFGEHSVISDRSAAKLPSFSVFLESKR